MANDDAPWLKNMQAIQGTLEEPGSGDNPVILSWETDILKCGAARLPASQFSMFKTYCAQYTHDDIAWCGWCMGYVFALCFLQGPYNPDDDLESLMWAQSWKLMKGTRLSSPRRGCIVVLARHVTLYVRTEDGMYVCVGGNQGDAVKESRFSPSDVEMMIWPDTAGMIISPTPPLPVQHPLIMLGDTGEAVREAQGLLRVPVTGIFDMVTDQATRQFQAEHGLLVDGEIGEETWPVLISVGGHPVINVIPRLPPELVTRISLMADISAIAKYSWQDRGRAPIGYTKGLAVTYAKVYRDFKRNDSQTRVMSQANTGSEEKDVMQWYSPQFAGLGMINAFAGVSVLRHLWVVLYGLGMRESSGVYWEGRDENVPISDQTAETTEAGLFQQSWNSKAASSEIRKLFDLYSVRPEGFVEVFQEGIPPRPSDLEVVGSGEGAAFQRLARTCPAFACEVAAVALRTTGGSDGHFGPIRRHESELRGEADDLLIQVQHLVDEFDTVAIPPEPRPPVVIPPKPEPPVMPDSASLVDAFMKEVDQAVRPIATKYLTAQSAVSYDAMRDEIIRRLGGTPPAGGVPLLPGPAAEIPKSGSGQTEAPATPPLEKPSVQLSAAGLGIGTILQALGIVGTPFGMGEEPTLAGTLTTLIPIVTGLVGSTGTFGTIFNALGKVIGAFRPEQPPK